MTCFALCLGLLLAGCGYRWQPEILHGEGRLAIAIPYVAGDSDGSLTQEIARALVTSGIGEVRQWGAPYTLRVSIVGAEGQTIGYRRDPQQVRGESQKNLVASERRKTIMVDVALYESDTNKVVCGPFRIEASADFDYVDGDSIQDLVFIAPDGGRQVVLPFSLGQLESSESAEEAATRPLNAQIAKKIVDAICAEW